MNSLENLIAYYNSCKQDDLYREVIRQMFRHIKRVADAGIYDLAEMCYTTPPTISRLSRKLGYKSFADFKMDLAVSVRNYETRNRYIPLNETGRYGSVQNAYLELMDRQFREFRGSLDENLIVQMLEAIHACRRISFYTYGISFSEPHFQEDLIMAGHECGVFPIQVDQLLDIEMLDESSMVIMIVPIVADNAIILREMELIKERKAKILLITDSKHTTFLKHADHSYCFDGWMSILDDYRFAMFVNLLSLRYRTQYID